MHYFDGIINYGILGLLAFMSVVAVAIAVERYLTYRKIRPSDFQDKRELELEVTKKLHLIATIGSRCPLYRPPRHRARHHVYILYDGARRFFGYR